MLKARRDKPQMNSAGYDTVIAKDVSLEGTIRASGVLRIDGKVRGTIETTGDLVVGKDGIVHADVKAAHVVISGELQGNVDVSGRLQILPGGKLIGDARVGVLVVEEGAAFKGQCEMELQRPGERAQRISRRIDTTRDQGVGAETPGVAQAPPAAGATNSREPTPTK